MEPKRLYRSRHEQILTGLCGGVAEFFNIDPTIIRVIWVIATLVTAVVPCCLAYFICSLIIPEEP